MYNRVGGRYSGKAGRSPEEIPLTTVRTLSDCETDEEGSPRHRPLTITNKYANLSEKNAKPTQLGNKPMWNNRSDDIFFFNFRSVFTNLQAILPLHVNPLITSTYCFPICICMTVIFFLDPNVSITQRTTVSSSGTKFVQRVINWYEQKVNESKWKVVYKVKACT